jgi:hypothetical protein
MNMNKVTSARLGGGPATAHARFALGVMTSVFGTHGDT